MDRSVMQILLVDDHPILRSGLRLLLEREPDLEVVGEAGSGSEALAAAQRMQPDLIILDLSIPDGDGLSILPHLLQVASNTRVLILTMHEEIEMVKEALAAGAAGYVLKRAVDHELSIAIRAIRRGETYVHSALTRSLLESQSREGEGDDRDPWSTLSEREFDVLTRVALGFTNAEIASEIHLSVKTVETYRKRAMDKLELVSRAELVRSAMRYGHLDAEG